MIIVSILNKHHTLLQSSSEAGGVAIVLHERGASVLVIVMRGVVLPMSLDKGG